MKDFTPPDCPVSDTGQDDSLLELFALLSQREEKERSARNEEARGIAEALGPKPARQIEEAPFGIGTKWIKGATPEDLERLAVLHARAAPRLRAIREINDEKERIRARCIKRVQRREQGID